MLTREITYHVRQFAVLIILTGIVFGHDDMDFSHPDDLDKIIWVSPCEVPPKIDGSLDDRVWHNARVVADFTQREPDNGAPPTEKTEVRFIYDHQSLYVGVRMYDSEPDKIVSRLAKRDDWMKGFEGTSDWFSLDLDSRHDHQTGFMFAVNAAGVKVDAMIFDDSDFDGDWDTVWDAEVNRDEFGWTLEIQIPFSILRYTQDDEMIWGIDMSRYIQHKAEEVSWMPKPRGEQGIASRFGHLLGLKDVPRQKQIELIPYLLTGYRFIHEDLMMEPGTDNPDHYETEESSFLRDLGLDIKYSLGSNSTLDMTINPDFGQIEADPAEINLTAFETYFPEKRPFFMENATTFDTPIEVFYSRRIGEEDAMIKAAGKLTGKTGEGWSYGLMTAKTTQESEGSWSDQFLNGRNQTYLIGRVLKDVLQGNSYLGAMGTYVSNENGTATVLSADSYLSALDNQVLGELQIVANDNDGVRGFGTLGEFSFKQKKLIRTWFEFEYYDRNFDISSSGYNWRNDLISLDAGIQMRKQEPWGKFRYGQVSLEVLRETNLDDLLLEQQVELDFHLTMMNYWRFGGGVNYSPDRYSDRITYDWDTEEIGPAVKLPNVTGAHFFIRSNYRKPIVVRFTAGAGKNSLGDKGVNGTLALQVRPTDYLEIGLSTHFGNSAETYHWLETVEDLEGTGHYMFSESDNHREVYTFSLSGNVSRDVSIQLYSEYFISRNDFSDYTELVLAKSFPEKTDFSPYSLDPGTGELLDPNLNTKLFSRYTSLNTNCVLRWEYVPGSTLYLVYSISKEVNGRSFEGVSDFLDYSHARGLTEGIYIQSLFLKLDYWLDY